MTKVKVASRGRAFLHIAITGAAFARGVTAEDKTSPMAAATNGRVVRPGGINCDAIILAVSVFGLSAVSALVDEGVT